jgi:hypothetical protein
LSSESLKDYESILAKRVTQLMDRLEGLSGPVDIAEWFSYFTYVSDSCEIDPFSNCFISRFDFMGDMACVYLVVNRSIVHLPGSFSFGGGFEMLRDGGDNEGLWTIIENGAK